METVRSKTGRLSLFPQSCLPFFVDACVDDARGGIKSMAGVVPHVMLSVPHIVSSDFCLQAKVGGGVL